MLFAPLALGFRTIKRLFAERQANLKRIMLIQSGELMVSLHVETFICLGEGQRIVGGAKQLHRDKIRSLLRSPERHFEILSRVGSGIVVDQKVAPGAVVCRNAHPFAKRQ